MLLSEGIEALVVATLADGRSQRTADGYREKLGVLLAYVGDKDVTAITVGDLRAYIADLRSRPSRYARTTARPEIDGGLSIASVAGYVRAVKRLFRWLHEEGLTPTNVAQRIKVPRVPRGEPKAADPDDFAKLLAATAGDDATSKRDRALLLFLADTGARVGGAAGLRLADLDIEHGQAKVTEKGNKARVVFFSEPTAQALAAWLAVRPVADHDRLWSNLGRCGAPWLTTEGIRQVLKRLGRRAGCSGPVNPHAWRHAFAREYLLAGGDLGTLADLMGHSDVTVTWQSYAIFRTAELQAKHAQLSPIARMGRKGEL